MAVKKKVIVAQDSSVPVPAEILAASIVRIGDAADRLMKSGLNRRAIILLLSASAKVGRPVVEAVLDAMLDLKSTYLSK